MKYLFIVAMTEVLLLQPMQHCFGGNSPGGGGGRPHPPSQGEDGSRGTPSPACRGSRGTPCMRAPPPGGGPGGPPPRGGTPLPGEGTPPRGGARMHQKGVPIPMGLQILESQRGSHVLTPFTKHRKRVSIPSKVPEKGARRGCPDTIYGCHAAVFWCFSRGA